MASVLWTGGDRDISPLAAPSRASPVVGLRVGAGDRAGLKGSGRHSVAALTPRCQARIDRELGACPGVPRAPAGALVVLPWQTLRKRWPWPSRGAVAAVGPG